jgi:hypothetical protein
MQSLSLLNNTHQLLIWLYVSSSSSTSSSDRTDLNEEVTRAIDNMYTEEGGYKKLIQALKHDSEYDYERIIESAQSPEVSSKYLRICHYSTIASGYNWLIISGLALGGEGGSSGTSC